VKRRQLRMAITSIESTILRSGSKGRRRRKRNRKRKRSSIINSETTGKSSSWS